jgi:leucine dehydrogenase
MEPENILHFHNKLAGLNAVIVIDNTALGPGVGGTRTHRYDNLDLAVADARRLARAMTLKCAIGGIAAGGAKCVIMDHEGLNRKKAFAFLGKEIQKLKGKFHTGGDLGTHAEDVRAMAEHSEYIHCEGKAIGDAVARGVVGCAAVAWASIAGKDLSAARVAVQGLGEVGEPVARAFHKAGARLFVTDIDEKRAKAIAKELNARVIPPKDFLTADVDILSPCAIGGILTAKALEKMLACIVCGAANNLFPEPALATLYFQNGVIVVPDFLASAGGAVHGIATSIMGLKSSDRLIAGLADTARAVLAESGELDEPPFAVAERMAWTRIQSAAKNG